MVERLQEQIRILEIRAGRAEQIVQDERRRRSRALEARRSTGLTEFGPGQMAYARPKLAIPWTFKGSYNELVNVLNWINTVTRYLDQCRVDPEDWSGFARTYMHSRVQARMDVMFPDTLSPPWDELVTELKDQYLPPDHSLRVELKFDSTTQRRGLEEYVERFQAVDAALTLAGVDMSDERKVTRFTRGLKDSEDRLFVLQKRPTNLKEAYQAVVTLRQAHVLCSAPTTRNKPKERQLRQARKQGDDSLPYPRGPKAGQKGCPGCGATWHTLPQCPKAKEAWNTVFSIFTQFASESASPAASRRSRTSSGASVDSRRAARARSRGRRDSGITHSSPSEGSGGENDLEDEPTCSEAGTRTSHPEEQEED